MKRITTSFLIVFVLMVINYSSSAQKTVVTEITENIGGTSNPAFSVFIDNADYRTVFNAWKSLFAEHNGKIETKKNDINISNAVFPTISPATIAVYSRIINDKTGIKIIAAFDKEGQYITSSKLPTETENVKKVIYDFAISIKKDMVQAELGAANKTLEKLRDENKDVLDKTEGLNKDIQSYNKKVGKAEMEILEKTDMTADDKTKKEKEVSNYKAKISEAENTINENEKKLTQIKVKIENQVKVVEDVKIKLNAVD